MEDSVCPTCGVEIKVKTWVNGKCSHCGADYVWDETTGDDRYGFIIRAEDWGKL